MTSPSDATSLPVPWPKDAEVQVYTGGCHCKKIRFEFEYPADIYTMPVINCNCSFCTDRGYLNVFTPENKFRFTTGTAEDLTVYKFGTCMLSHRFCSTCGTTIGPAVSEKGFVAVNTRTVDGIDLKRLQLCPVDGRSQSLAQTPEEENAWRESWKIKNE
ncbi:Mss4-like protein [Mycena polygramma]|nr:Mss4-like protein [Mycena polygramma]